MDTMASHRADTLNITLICMLADSVARHKGTTYEKALLHILQPASAMPGFPKLNN